MSILMIIIDTVLPQLLVRFVKKDERKYYESLLQYSREHLMVSSSPAMHTSFFEISHLHTVTHDTTYM